VLQLALDGADALALLIQGLADGLQLHVRVHVLIVQRLGLVEQMVLELEQAGLDVLLDRAVEHPIGCGRMRGKRDELEAVADDVLGILGRRSHQPQVRRRGVERADRSVQAIRGLLHLNLPDG
jgi:hypothetical protein